MPLPAPAPRQHLHTRAVTYRGFLREDGLWDIEGELSDTKTYAFEMSERGHMPPGSPVHGMAIRVTIDDRMVIHDIAAAMDATPYGECHRGEDPMRRMIGVAMGPGWRQAIEKALGGVRGCTHLRELLFNMATAAYQTIYPYKERLQRQADQAQQQREQPPYHLGRCIAWDFDGPLVATHHPKFAGWQPIRRVKTLAN
ncbi:DUF2889 domain-containing protein [Ramlibacter solisilvae]|uniref:DUF2889 domain-containing protein n=1 Tax=Ramlibacter tataouinensis TaxID=94132 RepID=A0A127JNX7_9BURK|nr:DUF2889 domain-containing protein [Ramlibacter tataouinensis]AMO21706.1 hypothetical protein UC35_00985 [Ramlibacter tataouinensis]